jgi:hypothetical protein
VTGPDPAWKPGARVTALLAVVSIVLLVFFDVIFRGRVLFDRDTHTLLWGQWTAFTHVVRGGAWPVWNPFIGFGQPLLANPGTQVLYPLTWLNLLLSPPDYVDLYAVVHLLLAGAGMLWLARTLRFSWTSATVTATAWMLSGPLLSAVDLWQHFAGAAWMPWVVAGAARTLAHPSGGRILGWALLQSAQVLTGSLDLVVLTAVPQVGLLILRLDWWHPLNRANGRRLAACALAATLTVAWTAALWVPAVDLLGRTARVELPGWLRMAWSVDLLDLVQLAIPLFPQDLPLSDEVRALLYGGREPLLTSLYLGIPALALALAAVASSRRRLALAAAATVAFSLTLALGRNALLYFWAMEAVPQLALLRYPVKATLLTAFAFSLLVGLGLETWRSGELTRQGGRWLAGAMGTLGVATLLVVAWARSAADSLMGSSETYPAIPGALEGVLAVATWSGSTALIAGGLILLAGRAAPSRRARLVGALGFLALLDLLVAHRSLNPTVDRAFVANTPDVVKILRADGARRIYTFDYEMRPAGTEHLGPEHLPALRRLPPVWRSLVTSQAYPFSSPRWALRGSFDLDVVGLDSRQRRSLRLLAIAVERQPPDFLRLLRVGGVDHVVAQHRKGLGLLEPIATIPHPTVGNIYAYRVPGTLSPVSFVTGTRIESGLEGYKTLLDPAFDPETTIVLAEGEPREPTDGIGGRVSLTSERADQLAVRIEADLAGFLLVTEGFDTGWRATVDGHEAPMLRANKAFRAVPVPAGSHQVEMIYRPPAVRRALVISGSSIVLTLAVVLLVAWSRRRRAHPRGEAG